MHELISFSQFCGFRRSPNPSPKMRQSLSPDPARTLNSDHGHKLSSNHSYAVNPTPAHTLSPRPDPILSPNTALSLGSDSRLQEPSTRMGLLFAEAEKVRLAFCGVAF